MMGDKLHPKAWVLGPKAENQDVFEKFLLEALRDYCYWRRNFHPEDNAYVTAADRQAEGFQNYHQVLHDHLFDMLSRLKLSVPFFSPRYLGHMLTDLLMPGVLGYFAAMLYNQNNIYEEVANVTMALESEAMRLIAEMLRLPPRTAWGHLCSGGTAANMESLWVARDLRLLPYQVALALAECKPADAVALRALPVGTRGTFGEWSDSGRLAEIWVDEIIRLHEGLSKVCQTNTRLAALVERKSVGELGLARFSQECREKLGESYPANFRIVLSQSAHYSLRKSVGITGLGEANLVVIPLDRDMRLDMAKAEAAIRACHQRREAVVAVIGVYGSTEESAIDDFAELIQIRNRCRSEGGGDFWIHADACYGGYAAAITQPDADAADIASFLAGVAEAAGCEFRGAELPWGDRRMQYWLRNTLSLGECDSVTIDPHKLGYIPFPAGGVLYRHYRVREFIRCDAPYLNAAPAEELPSRTAASGEISSAGGFWHTPAMGKYTLEGSRPGAYGAAVWLAHKTVPLNRHGHGLMVAQSLLGAHHLQRVLKRELPTPPTEGIGCSFLCDAPDLNILCYTFPARLEGEDVPLSVVNRSIDRLYSEFLPSEKHPIQTRDFVVSKTSLDLRDYGEALVNILGRLGLAGKLVAKDEIGTVGNPWRDDSQINFVRSVVMGPFLLQAVTKSKTGSGTVDLATEYARTLRENLERIMLAILDSPIEEERRPQLQVPVLVLEDEYSMSRDLCDELRKISFRTDPDLVLTTNKMKEAEALAGLGRQRAARKAPKIEAALVDLKLNDRRLGGLEFLKHILPQPYFKGAVIFADFDDAAIRREVKRLGDAFPHKTLRLRRKPTRLVGRSQAQFNRVMQDLWEILNAPGRGVRA
jgi:glutamate/tyrosine decarboxylase-like PLP-dependent enzyme